MGGFLNPLSGGGAGGAAYAAGLLTLSTQTVVYSHNIDSLVDNLDGSYTVIIKDGTFADANSVAFVAPADFRAPGSTSGACNVDGVNSCTFTPPAGPAQQVYFFMITASN